MHVPERWTDEGGAEGVLYEGRLSITAKPSMVADDGTVIVGIDLPDHLRGAVAPMDVSVRRQQALADIYECATDKGDPRELLDAIRVRAEHPALRCPDPSPTRGAVSSSWLTSDEAFEVAYRGARSCGIGKLSPTQLTAAMNALAEHATTQGGVADALDAMEADAQRRLDAGDAPMVAQADLDAIQRVRRLTRGS